MKVIIKYFGLESDHIFAQPTNNYKTENVEVTTMDEVDQHIEKQRDEYGHPFEKNEFNGFQYTSHTGGIKIELYKEPTFKTL